MSQTVIRLQ